MGIAPCKDSRIWLRKTRRLNPLLTKGFGFCFAKQGGFMSSLWTENIEMPEFPTLEKDIRTQVLIIGGGMAGVFWALFF